MLEQYIEKLRPIVIDLFKDDSSGHDIGHLERTMRLALHIQEKEGGDRLVIGISAFLHDVHRILQNSVGHFVSPKESLSTVREILSNTDLDEETIKKICYCIEYHEHYNWNGNNVDDINALILQDADNLEAIGAIGIGRTFSYGGSHNLPMYDESVALNENNDYSEFKESDKSTIHHFYHKLFKLKDNMNTTTAKAMAEERTSFMIKFVDEFFAEWKGEK
jgi:uncharacterized protein